MYIGEDSDSIPMDLAFEILSRLPTKSIVRFRFVSKLWRSMLCRSYFTDLFLTRSSSNPRLLIGVVQDGEWFFYSTPQPKNPYEKSSLLVTADFLMKFSKDISQDHRCIYTSGLIYFSNMRIKDDEAVRVIFNPSTGQYAILPPTVAAGELPESRTDRKWGGFLGFDPIGKQFKVLLMNSIMADNKNAFEPFYVFYINPEKNTLLKVETQGVKEDHECLNNHRVYAFVDHVENLHATFI